MNKIIKPINHIFSLSVFIRMEACFIHKIKQKKNVIETCLTILTFFPLAIARQTRNCEK